ncbi:MULTISPECIES: ATP-binding cassette domain-containing protein [unclassified Tolypothrix]|uniref:ATP-binding cassette domain-containing protein n=1 Tax=unclassified Tolypothrix TaxID=2649714 RepID=UPI0005EAB321|nr:MULTISPECIES: ATP-binding cassette domain-containing protein [unclassified Tolypothrix]BAY95494.1 ABC exporter ATP-binding subunit, DevA family protein [Microchaete diplosiphon NIES-3275]EKE97241.1 heterocyst-specific ABC superfamily ATP binding protein [Tolypothrix sp. PCC 7601]MBE9084893.1 ATP-binding cassette domain-containing protein [Tolypothrix sp. LEGE 11397]UYD30602.1 ATP-binding cassette domain-containing protein [Tolypothrix sp. PCC 7712]UYD38471.1 ATP-binding cassette domain-cont
MLNSTIVNIRNLNYYYETKRSKIQVLFDINLEIKTGEFVFLTGPSGSGKSTLLSLIGGLRSVQEGSIEVFGYELKKMNQRQGKKVRRLIGYIFQASNLVNCLTVQQNLQMSLKLNPIKYSRKEMIELSNTTLEMVGLDHRINYYPDDLSGGEKQRAAIACALVNKPKLILADEPTAALDGKSAQNIINLMHHLVKQEETSILMITHDNRFLNIADHIIHIQDGKSFFKSQI